MYATISHDVTSGASPTADVRAAVVALVATRDTFDLLSDTFICSIENAADFLDLVKDLKKIGTDFPDQFQFICTQHRTNDLLRANDALPAAAKAIIAGA